MNAAPLALLAVVLTGCAPTIAAATPPDLPFRVATDSIPRAEIAGCLWRASGKPRGTIFMCHGFGRSMWDFRGYTWLADDARFNVVRFDFREHGASTRCWNRLPTLGYHEIWDLKAVIDWAEAHQLEKPYLCYGHSMGAAIALRWAGMDERIAGVMAQSPFRNALDATRQFRPGDCRLRLASTLLVRGGRREMLREVDIPTAVAQRDDLMLYVTVGEHDYFPEKDVRAIVDASPSPPDMKRFMVIPGAGHGDQWKWVGNDRLIHEFLQQASPQRARAVHHTVAAVPAVGAGVIVLIRCAWKRVRAA